MLHILVHLSWKISNSDSISSLCHSTRVWCHPTFSVSFPLPFIFWPSVSKEEGNNDHPSCLAILLTLQEAKPSLLQGHTTDMLSLLSTSSTPFQQSYSPGCLSSPTAAGTAPFQVHNFCICLFWTSWPFCQPIVLRPLWTVALPSNYKHSSNFVPFPKMTRCALSQCPCHQWRH